MGFTDIKRGLYFFLEFPRESLSLAFSSLLRLPTSLGSCPFFHHQRLPALCPSDPALRHISLSTQPRKFLHLQGFMDWASQVAHWWGRGGIHLPCRRHKRCEFNPWFGKYSWRRKWRPTPVFLPKKLHGQRSLVGCSLVGLWKSWTWLSDWVHTHLD